MTGAASTDYLIQQEELIRDDRSNQQQQQEQVIDPVDPPAKPIEVRSKELITSSNKESSSIQPEETKTLLIKVNKEHKARTIARPW